MLSISTSVFYKWSIFPFQSFFFDYMEHVHWTGMTDWRVHTTQWRNLLLKITSRLI